MTASLLSAAMALYDAGCCVVPARPDGSKAPALREWRRYQLEQPTAEQVEAWLGNGAFDGFGVICGAVSGSLEMLEFEGRAIDERIYNAYLDLLADHGYKELWEKIVAGYTELTPGGGLHILYRVNGLIRGNTKLARRPATAGELAVRPDEKIKVLIETRGEGGFTILAPSGGRTHPTGRSWQMTAGGPATIVTISEDERDALHAVATLLDQQPPSAAPPSQGTSDLRDHDRPGDDFTARASWDEILSPHGWRCIRSFGSDAHGWRRPGKETPGISATTRDKGGLYAFSTSTGFDTETPYSKFAAYALLNHGGDYSAAAAQLARRGYGTPGLHADRDISDLIASVPPDPTVVPPEAPPEVQSRTEYLLSRVLGSRELDDLPSPSPLIDGIFNRNSLIWLHGKPGSAKSFVALDMGACIAAGLPWQEHEVSGGPVLYVIAEGAAGMGKRKRAWEDQARERTAVKFLPVAVQMGMLGDVAALCAVMEQLHPVFVILDTQARVTVGMEENSAKDMGVLINSVDQLRRVGDAGVMLVHHEPRNGENPRGSTGLEGAADTQLRVVKDGPHVILSNPKQKEGEEFKPIHLVLRPRLDSAVIATGNDLGSNSLPDSQQKLLLQWQEAFGCSIAVSSRQLINTSGLPERTCYAAINRLVTDGYAVQIGTPKQPRYQLKETP